MKKTFTALMMAAMFAVMIPAFSSSAMAQTRYYNGRTRTTSVYQRPNVYRRHRNLFNILIGTGAGAVVGGLVGGRRGAGIGALVGAGGSALYTYKLNPKKRYYRRY
ncbi:MAG: glycine zipper domain-containing protein [Acidobacteriota bacterium]